MKRKRPCDILHKRKVGEGGLKSVGSEQFRGKAFAKILVLEIFVRGRFLSRTETVVLR